MHNAPVAITYQFYVFTSLVPTFTGRPGFGVQVGGMERVPAGVAEARKLQKTVVAKLTGAQFIKFLSTEKSFFMIHRAGGDLVHQEEMLNHKS